MKKIVFGLIVAMLALSFMGCPTTYDETYDYASPSAYIIGNMTDSNWATWIEAPYNEATGLNVLTRTMAAGDTFKFTPQQNWTTEWGFAALDEATAKADFIEAGASVDPLKANIVITEAGTYTFSVNAAKGTINIVAAN